MGARSAQQRHMGLTTRVESWESVFHDARLAWRANARAPGFSILVTLTFTLGVGLTSATFSLLDRIYFRPPEGVTHPAAVRRIWLESSRFEGGQRRTFESLPYPMWRVVADASGDASALAVMTAQSARLGGTLRGVETRLQFASANYFTLLGVRPALGRFYTRDEDRIGNGANVVVLSHDFWRKQMGANAAVVGRTVRFNAAENTVIGVAQPGFRGIDLSPADVWLPLAVTPQQDWMRGRLFELPSMFVFQAFLHVSPAWDPRAFAQRATMALRESSRDLPRSYADTSITVSTGSIIHARGPGEPDQEMVISSRIGAVAVIVLLITGANVVHLFLARALRRRKELAVRLALGVTRWRLVRLLTAEAVLLGLLAAAGAGLMGWLGGTWLRSLLFPGIAWPESAMHVRVVCFTAAVAVLSGMVTGVIPALQFSRPHLTSALHSGSREGSRHPSQLRNSLLIAQAALSMMLLVGAGLFIRSLRNVKSLDIGFDSHQLLFGRVAFEPGQAPPEAVVGAGMDEVEEQLRSRSGIEAVARAGIEPMQGLSFYRFYWGPGGADSSGAIQGRFPVVSAVSPEFFTTAGIRFLRGTVFDRAAGAEVVVNQAMAGLLWPDAEPIGQCLRLGERTAPCHSVVGVVETVRRERVIEEPSPQYYLPLGTAVTREWAGTTVIVRVRPGTEVAVQQEMSALLRRAFPAADPVIHAMSESLEPQYRPWRLGAKLFSALGLLALLVAVVGVYSSISYAVSQRTHELGVRVALGARVMDLLTLVVGEGLRVIGIGLLLGSALAVAAGRLITTLLYEVEPSDPLVMLAASAALMLAAGLAAAIPAWRGARVDPDTALRSS
ncbi:MAG TPA: ABC transporter permease [Gemmatimonadales bacterium]|nr:ABC transporter permease [Gemmatimonadales bacterium]